MPRTRRCEFCAKITMTRFQSAQSTRGQHGMRSCDSYRARITAIFATAINHPIRSPASSANPHNHAPHGVSGHHGDSGPVILCMRESPHAFPHAHSHAHSHTTCTVRHAPSTTARAKLHAVPQGSVTAHAHEQAHARARVVSQRCGMHGMHGTHGMHGIDAQMACMA